MTEGKRVRLSKGEMLDFTARILNNSKGAIVKIVLKGPDTKVAFWASGELVATVKDGIIVIYHKETITNIELSSISKISLMDDLPILGYITNDLALVEQNGLWEYYSGENRPALWLHKDDNRETVKTDNIVDLAEYKARKYKK